AVSPLELLDLLGEPDMIDDPMQPPALGGGPDASAVVEEPAVQLETASPLEVLDLLEEPHTADEPLQPPVLHAEPEASADAVEPAGEMEFVSPVELLDLLSEPEANAVAGVPTALVETTSPLEVLDLLEEPHTADEPLQPPVLYAEPEASADAVELAGEKEFVSPVELLDLLSEPEANAVADVPTVPAETASPLELLDLMGGSDIAVAVDEPVQAAILRTDSETNGAVDERVVPTESVSVLGLLDLSIEPDAGSASAAEDPATVIGVVSPFELADSSSEKVADPETDASEASALGPNLTVDDPLALDESENQSDERPEWAAGLAGLAAAASIGAALADRNMLEDSAGPAAPLSTDTLPIWAQEFSDVRSEAISTVSIGPEEVQTREAADALDNVFASMDAEIGASGSEAVSAAVEASLSTQHVVFQLCGTRYAVPIHEVLELSTVPRITSIPNVPEFLRGVTNLRGDVLAVIELRTFLGLTANSETPRERMLVVRPDGGDAVAGLIVDSVLGLAAIARRDLKQPVGPLEDPVVHYLAGVTEHEEHVLHALDLQKLFRAPEIVSLSAH
ncbi:MAG: chemotaxis protein CheW, partial [Bryobacterales bacterium]|nr:chemotaxis protein CheW [Bryobacterales bacterium]